MSFSSIFYILSALAACFGLSMLIPAGVSYFTGGDAANALLGTPSIL
jgi:hypothetical protein